MRITPFIVIRYFTFYNAIVSLCLPLFVSLTCQAQAPRVKHEYDLQAYIKQYSEEAVRQMIEFKIPASVILAQAIFESAGGTSYLATKSNNHFGIKCHEEWTGDTITKTDDKPGECFRKYNSVRESFTDHSIFLSSRARYAFLFKLPLNNYKGWCLGLKNAGYATYSKYAEDLINLINNEKLYELDNSIYLKNKPLAFAREAKPGKIKVSPLKISLFTLSDFGKENVLWLDEKDVLIQSLGMVIDTDNEEMVLASD